jgi:DNA-binding MarR family transcriptional regulator
LDELDRETRERHFVEEMGLLMAQAGEPPMMGRVLGRLLICDPPHQSSAELAEYLQASAGSISTTTRALQAAGLIERAPVPGERATYFRLRAHPWGEVMRRQAVILRLSRECAERGLAALEGEPEARKARLHDFHDFYAFFEERLPEMIDAWAARTAPVRRVK